MIRTLLAVLTAATLTAPGPARPPHPPAHPPAPAPVRIMPLGDSITYGSGSTYGSGYRGPLVGALRVANTRIVMVGSLAPTGTTGPYVHHEGRPGWTLANILTHITHWCTTHRPDVVLLHAGTNDIRDHTRTPPATMAAQLAEILRRIRTCNPSATVLLARPIITRAIGVTAASAARWNAHLAAYDRRIVAVAATAHPRARLVDMRYVTGADGMSDALHPNDLGYSRMAARWYTTIRNTPAVKDQN